MKYASGNVPPPARERGRSLLSRRDAGVPLGVLVGGRCHRARQRTAGVPPAEQAASRRLGSATHAQFHRALVPPPTPQKPRRAEHHGCLRYAPGVTSLEAFAAVIADPLSSRDDLDRACARLYEIFAAITAPLFPAAAAEGQRLDSGIALSPALAAKCLLDSARTAAFVRGTVSAVREAVRRFAPEPVEVLYAGTGPFAPLALLAMPLLDCRSVRFTLLDVNAGSVRSVAHLGAALGLSPYVRDVVQADATAYRHPSALHVVISETMQRTLAEEPFVAILRNLRPQLAPGGILVPERVSIALASIDAHAEQARWRGAAVPPDVDYAGTVFEVDAQREWPAEGEHTTLQVHPRRDHSARWLAL